MLRRCRRFLSEQNIHHHQHHDSSANFGVVVSRLAILHKSLMGRDRAPSQMVREAAAVLASELALETMTPSGVSYEYVPAFAAQVAVFVNPERPPSDDFFERLAQVFSHHLEVAAVVIERSEGRNTFISSPSSSLSLSSSSSSSTGGGGAGAGEYHHRYHEVTGSLVRMGHRVVPPSWLPRLVASMIECIVALCGNERSLDALRRAITTRDAATDLSECLKNAQLLGRRLMALEAQQVNIAMPSSSSSSSTNIVKASLALDEPVVARLAASSSSSSPTASSSSSSASSMMMSSPPSSGMIHCTPRDVIAFLKGADILIGGPASFSFAKRGVPPLVMLPIKSKHDMLRKTQKFQVLHDLVRALDRRLPTLTRIDALVCLKCFAVVGIFHQPIVDACVERILSGLVLTPHIQKAEAILHLGVLGHRHVAGRDIVASINTAELGAAGMRKLLRGMAMLQMMPTVHSADFARKVHDHVWMFTLRPSERDQCDLAWHIDVAHALAALKIPHYQFLLRTCRKLRGEEKHRHYLYHQQEQSSAGGDKKTRRNEQGVGALTHLQRSQLLWTLGQVKRTSVPADLDKHWVKNVNRVKNALIRCCREAVQTEDAETASLLWQGLEAVGVSAAEAASASLQQQRENQQQQQQQQQLSLAAEPKGSKK